MSTDESRYYRDQEIIRKETERLMEKPDEYQQYSKEQIWKAVTWELTAQRNGEEKVLKAFKALSVGQNEHATTYGRKTLEENVAPLAECIKEKIRIENQKQANHRNPTISYISELDPFHTAAYTLEVIVSSISSELTVQNVAIHIGKKIEKAILADILSAAAPKFWNYNSKNVRDAGGLYKQSKVLQKILKYITSEEYKPNEKDDEGLINDLKEKIQTEGITSFSFSKETELNIGRVLIEMVVESLDLIKIDIEQLAKNKRISKIKPTLSFVRWAQDHINELTTLSPEWYPTPIKPKKWSTPFDGGYHSNAIKDYNLVTGVGYGYLKRLAKQHMPTVYSAVNAAQGTAWRVNQNVFNVAMQVWKNTHKEKMECLPDKIIKKDGELLPRCPSCGQHVTKYEMINKTHVCFEDKESYKKWRRLYDSEKKRVEANASKNLEVDFILSMATTLKDESVFYFPMFLDFRGRLYSRVSFLSPQGNGLSRGILEFAEGKPLGDSQAADWLAIHIANAWGLDKQPFAERIQWVHDNTNMLLNVADDPINNTEWQNLDLKDAWVALAGCFEWRSYIQHGRNHVSHMPVAMDGTCSGLQHYAALCKDFDTAKEVNVAPSETPQDIYRTVAEEALKLIEKDIHKGGFAKHWYDSGLVTRKMTKRPVMTLPYGITKRSATQYIYEYYLEEKEKGNGIDDIAHQNERKACNWLGDVVWTTIEKKLTVAPEAMFVLQEIARLLAKNNVPIVWSSPTGFLVEQCNYKCDKKRINLRLSGDIFSKDRHEKYTISTQQKKELDLNKQKNGIAPNFIHSLDAAALMSTVHTMKHFHGVSSFALIHDSFATHAADAVQLAQTLRDEFITIYVDSNIIEDLYSDLSECVEQYDTPKQEKLKTLINMIPSNGMDVGIVKDSVYFFC